MVGSDERRHHWNQVYDRGSDQEVSWFQPRPEVSLELIGSVDLVAPAPVIDVGGGASRLVDHLLERGHDVTVLDVSPRALEASRHRLGPRADRVRWIEADITTYSATSRFAIWHDRAVFHFLTEPADRQKYVETMSRALLPGAHAIIATFAEDGPTRCSGLPVVRYSKESLGAELGTAFSLVDARDEIHRTPDGRDQAFVYCLFRKRTQGCAPH